MRAGPGDAKRHAVLMWRTGGVWPEAARSFLERPEDWQEEDLTDYYVALGKGGKRERGRYRESGDREGY